MVACSGGSDFKKFSDKLPTLNAPMKFSNSGLIRHQSPQSHEQDLFARFAPQGADKVLGKLYGDDKTVSIIYQRSGDVDTPVLMIYSMDGVKLDSLNLFMIDSADFGSEVRRVITLSQDRKIETIDSILTWSEIFTEGEPDITQATRIQTLSMDTVIRVIDSNGKIVRQ